MQTTNIIVALDLSDKAKTLDLVEKLNPAKCHLKVGKELFTRFGPSFVSSLIVKGFKVFLDLKFHDIPNTVANAVTAAADLGVWMVNVHALGGRRMMEAARVALDKTAGKKPLLISVTILTSLNQEDLAEVGMNLSVPDLVLRLATLTQTAGLDGVVCSAQEAKLLRQKLGSNFLLVTPGIRLETSPEDDQQRIVTPAQAIANGVDYMVIGRPITQAKDPMRVIDEIYSV